MRVRRVLLATVVAAAALALGTLGVAIAWALLELRTTIEQADGFFLMYVDLPAGVTVASDYVHDPIWGILLAVVMVASAALAVFAAVQGLRGRPFGRLSGVGLAVAVASLFALTAL